MVTLFDKIKNRVLCFTVIDYNHFKNKFNRKKKDIWNSDGEDSDSARSNASNQSQLSARPQSTTVPLPQNRSRKRPGKSDEIKSK